MSTPVRAADPAPIEPDGTAFAPAPPPRARSLGSLKDAGVEPTRPAYAPAQANGARPAYTPKQANDMRRVGVSALDD